MTDAAGLVKRRADNPSAPGNEPWGESAFPQKHCAWVQQRRSRDAPDLCLIL